MSICLICLDENIFLFCFRFTQIKDDLHSNWEFAYTHAIYTH